VAIYQLGSDAPVIPDSAYVAAEATVIGKVTLGERVSVWPGAVIRADDDTIVIGDDSNVQDCAVLHVDPGLPLVMGRGITVGHHAMLHGCTIGDDTLVGIRTLVYNRAVIGRECLIGAGAIVTEGKTFPDRTLILGVPAKAMRVLTDEDIAGMRNNTEAYVKRRLTYKASLKRIG
jgi:carbonic anhydrase/acetyltransferase-like protein (isoleucine patch superfamily)